MGGQVFSKHPVNEFIGNNRNFSIYTVESPTMGISSVGAVTSLDDIKAFSNRFASPKIESEIAFAKNARVILEREGKSQEWQISSVEDNGTYNLVRKDGWDEESTTASFAELIKTNSHITYENTPETLPHSNNKLSDSEFEKKLPFKENAVFYDKNWLVTGYDQSTGAVTLERTILRNLDNVSGLKPGELIRAKIGNKELDQINGSPSENNDLVWKTEVSGNSSNVFKATNTVSRKIVKYESIDNIMAKISESPNNIKILSETKSISAGERIKNLANHLIGLSKPTSAIELVGTGNIKANLNSPEPKKLDYEHHSSSQSYDLLFHEYDLQIKGLDKPLKLLIPALNDGKTNNQILEKMIGSLEKTPKELINSMESLVISPYPDKPNQAAKASSDKTITIYPNSIHSTIDSLTNIINHELGHTSSIRDFSHFNLDDAWADSIAKDKNEITHYGQSETYAEGFAEAVTMYVLTDGGRLAPEYRDMYKNRFLYLDNFFSADPNRLILAEKALKEDLEKAKLTVAGSLILGVTTELMMLSEDESDKE